ncbi:MAG: hypothetical protein V6D39_09820 [Dolichospermum lemmermannii FEM_B0920]
MEDKLSVIAKNSSPNASPVQLSVVSGQLLVVRRKKEGNRSIIRGKSFHDKPQMA